MDRRTPKFYQPRDTANNKGEKGKGDGTVSNIWARRKVKGEETRQWFYSTIHSRFEQLPACGEPSLPMEGSPFSFFPSLFFPRYSTVFFMANFSNERRLESRRKRNRSLGDGDERRPRPNGKKREVRVTGARIRGAAATEDQWEEAVAFWNNVTLGPELGNLAPGNRAIVRYFFPRRSLVSLFPFCSLFPSFSLFSRFVFRFVSCQFLMCRTRPADATFPQFLGLVLMKCASVGVPRSVLRAVFYVPGIPRERQASLINFNSVLSFKIFGLPGPKRIFPRPSSFLP